MIDLWLIDWILIDDLLTNYFWIINDWLIIDWWLHDWWLMIEWWSIDDWYLIDLLIIDKTTLVIHWLIERPFPSKSSKQHKSKTIRASILPFLHNVHHLSRFMCHMSHVTCHLLSVRCNYFFLFSFSSFLTNCWSLYFCGAC